MKAFSALTILLTLTLSNSCLAQDASFVAYVTYDSVSGNFIISYNRDTLTGRILHTLLIPETKIRPKVNTVASQINSVFQYRYTVINQPGGRQNIYSFDLEVKSPLDSLILPEHWSHGPYEYESFVQTLHDFQSEDIMIGDSLHFSTLTSGLPGFVLMRFGGAGTEDTLDLAFEWEPDESVDLLIDSLASLEAIRHVALTTIGGVNLPSPFMSLFFIDTLLSYTRQSAALGWLGRDRDDDCDDDERPDDGVVRNIENRLQKARRELVRGDSVKARRELLKLVRKVDRLQRRGERVMTSEAYALLKYNTEYLIERLPERRRR